jgi:hypothetical protein
MPIKTISRYEISSEDAECVLLVELEGGCIQLTPEGGESIMITLDQAADLMKVLYRICGENS